MNARSHRTRMWKRAKSVRRRETTLRGFEQLESRQVMAVQLEVRLDAVALDGVTAITSLSQGQEFLLRGQAKDLRSPTDPNDPGQGPFQVYTDIAYDSTEVAPRIGEVQRLSFTGTPVGGSFTLSYKGTSTAAIDFQEFNQGPDQAQLIQDALDDIPALAGNVRVEQDTSVATSLPPNRYFIRFINALGNQDVDQLVADGSLLETDPTDPNATADAVVTEFAKGLRSNPIAFKQAFAYHARTDAVNLITTQYPDNRQGADAANLFDNVGGGAPTFTPPGTGMTTYFTLRARAVSGGADNAINFVNGPSNESDIGLKIFLFGQNNPLPTSDIKFTYGANGTNTTSLHIPVSTPITVVDDTSYSVSEDSPAFPLPTSPLANDTQTPATPRTLVISNVSAGSGGGALTIIDNGQNVSYKPAANFFGTETFTYTVSDGKGHTADGEIQIQVTPVNDPPSFTKGPNVSVNENSGAKTVANWATNISAGPGESAQTITFDVTTNNDALFSAVPQISSTGTLTFTPAANKTGQATVTVTLSDNGTGNNTSAAQTFTITVNGVNSAPVNSVPGPQSIVVATNLVFQGATKLSVSDSDAGSGDVVTTLSVTAGQLTLGGAIGAGLVVTGDGTGSISLTGTIAEVNAAIATVTYRSNAGFQGADTLTMVTDDQGNTGAGGAKSDTDTVTINVTAPQPPMAADDNRTIVEDAAPLTIDVLANDTVHTGSQGILESFTQPASGGTVTRFTNNTPTQTDDKLIFTPASNFNGNVTFTYTMNDTDGTGSDSVGTVTVNVTPVNDPPSVVPHSYSVNEDGVLNISAPGLLVGASDREGDAITAHKVTDPQNGTLTVNANGSFTYRPNADFNGTDTFTYRGQDSKSANSVARTVTITVNPVADPPTAQDKNYSATEDTAKSVAANAGLLVGANDPDGQTLHVAVGTSPSKGSLNLDANTGAFVYTPNANANGQDTFTYRVVATDGRQSTLHTVTIDIAPVNDRPVANPDSGYTTSQDTQLVIDVSRSVLKNDTDIDGDPLTTIRIDAPTHGTVTLNANGSFTYTPNAGFVGTDTFTYQARDNSGAANNTSVKTTVTINVTDVNDPPTAVNKTYSIAEDGTLTVSATNGLLVGASDPEGSQLSAKFVSQPGKGQLIATGSNGSFTYKPKANFNGTDSFTYRVNDGQVDSALRTVTINVSPVNDPPPAVNDNFKALRNVPTTLPDVLANDRAAFNVDGTESLRIIAFQATSAQGGSITRNSSGRFVYSPQTNFSGADSFRYTVGDGHGGWKVATVNLDVAASAPSTIAGSVYRDLNSNGRRDSGERGMGNVVIRLEGIGNTTSRSVVTAGDGSYKFTNVLQGSYRIEETQPDYTNDGLESLGSIGGTKGNDFFTLTTPAVGVQATGYNFGELGLQIGQNPEGKPPLQLTLAEILASNSNFGALIALDGTQQKWFTKLDDSWNGVSALSAQLSADSSRLVLAVVVNSKSYRATIFTNEADALHFRIMATNNNGFQVVRLDGALDLSQFTQVTTTAAATDKLMASW